MAGKDELEGTDDSATQAYVSSSNREGRTPSAPDQPTLDDHEWGTYTSTFSAYHFQ